MTGVEFIAKITCNAIDKATRRSRERISNVEGVQAGSSERDCVSDERSA